MWVNDLYSCKMTSQNILVDPTRGTLKAKRKKHVLQLMSWPAHSVDLKHIELVWDELDRKVRTKQPTSAAHLWPLLQESYAELSSVYLQSLVEEMPRICEAVIAVKKGHFDESKSSFCVFWWLIGLVVWVFTNGLGDLGSIPGRVIPKTLKMVLGTSLLNTQ